MTASRWRNRVVLDWSTSTVAAAEQPCVLCGRPTVLLSPAGRPCHKACAEEWTEQREQNGR